MLQLQQAQAQRRKDKIEAELRRLQGLESEDPQLRAGIGAESWVGSCTESNNGDARPVRHDGQHGTTRHSRRANPKHEQRIAPSMALQVALTFRGLEDLIDSSMVPAHKVDFSHTSPAHTDARVYRRRMQTRMQVDFEALLQRTSSLTTIAARYIITSKNGFPTNSSELPITIEQKRYLDSRHYSVDDVKLWAHILTEPDVDRAAAALRRAHVSGTNSPGFVAAPPPSFVFTTFLRRPFVSAAALQNVIDRVWIEIQHGNPVHGGPIVSSTDVGVENVQQDADRDRHDGSSLFLIVIRLMRHARVVRPSALSEVAAIFVNASILPSKKGNARDRRHSNIVARLSLWYNALLRLLAIPSTGQTFLAVTHHQGAQFDLVAAMALHDPPLTISRDGYRAIISVQLSLRKTKAEQDWSQLKAKSWPPWKQEKTGLDAEKGFHYGRSRAMDAIAKAVEAGYGTALWEKTAQTLAGWDADYTPTIQTRASLGQKYEDFPTGLAAAAGRDVAKDFTSPSLWVARIASTRTIQEAWACFLSFKDFHSHTVGKTSKANVGPVYCEMLTKLLAKEVQARPDGENGDSVGGPREPGDHREVYPTPEDSDEVTYVQTDPPSADVFAREMYEQNVPISGKALERLILGANKFREGLRYTYWGSRHDTRLECLLVSDSATPVTQDRRFQLRAVPAPIYRAFMGLLCRFSSAVGTFVIPNSGITWQPQCSGLAVALQLAEARDTPQIRPFNYILAALSLRRNHFVDLGETFGGTRPAPMVARYHLMLRIIEKATQTSGRGPHMGDFGHLCLQLLQAAISDALEAKSRLPDEQHSSQTTVLNDGVTDVHSLLRDSSAKVQRQFCEATTGTIDLQPTISRFAQGRPVPKLLVVPSPILLHAMVRTLGLLCDHQAILSLMNWLRAYEAEINTLASAANNGRRALRDTAIAARVFFERSWVEHEPGTLVPTAASESKRRKLVDLIEDSSLFAPWPSDAEVYRYCVKSEGRLPAE